ncbi:MULTISPECIES: CaiB/BaiF CoA-transferase family protein [unclassified Rhodococcus (in: high G+C Gram-positive bacteria)]|uniref:CaiB/BaiF CoA transferase family protein n=1 Tax=unclassified Rhodococcus (in: high G+C Gram-positive bacteria) TaxID=192944 RepID=UPI00163AC7B3|nr:MULTISPECIES: CaiB/BaiF CoA-transferase family protein [unclassified Rhodococcus (in: high G+C Gram-positive bacteria)]MBC2642110.1 CoA transferase [Rhodococcus sp. 3A]MBC2893148.1 CoA transferase [Rhodococcus sp. 4CII]
MVADTAKRSFTGPLSGLRVVEIGSIGPGPFCAMLLADLGADVIRVDRAAGAGLVGPNADFRAELLHRGRRSLAVDLKHPDGAEVVLSLVADADVLIEGFRPGVAERLGIGPDDCAARNPGLIYGRMTGFGQDGPLAQHVGHDINYVALSGALSLIGRQGQPPTPPLSLVGDFGGGGMLLALGVVSALFERQRSGLGQVVDAAMVEGAALLATPFFGFAQNGTWDRERGTNIVDSGAPYYDAYETADGKWLAVGAMEPHFYADLVTLLDLPDDLPDQNDRSQWPQMKKIFADAVRGRTLTDWLDAAEGLTPCIAPVLDVDEAPSHPHHVARGSFVDVDGLVQPAPAPRFSRTAATVDRRPPLPGEHTTEILTDWEIDTGRVADWLRSGAVREAAAET